MEKDLLDFLKKSSKTGDRLTAISDDEVRGQRSCEI